MADQVGEVYLKVRVDSSGIGDDIKRGSQRELDQAGTALGKSISDAMWGRDTKARFRSGLRKMFDDSGGDAEMRAQARNLVRSFTGTFTKVLSTDFATKWLKRIKIGFWSSFFALPALGGAAKAITGILGGLTAVVGNTATALVGGLGAIGGAVAQLGAVGVGLLVAFKGMDDATKQAFGESIKQAAGNLTQFDDKVRKGLLPGLVDAVKNFSALDKILLPFGTKLGNVAGNLARTASAAFAAKENFGPLKNFLDSTIRSFKRIGESVTGAFGALPKLLEALSPLAERFADSLGNIVDKWTKLIEKGSKSGSLEATLDKWYDRAEVISRSFGNMGKAIWSIFKIGADVADPFMQEFEALTKQWDKWAKSAEGQQTIKTFFENSMPVLKETLGLLGDIIKLFTTPLTEEGATDGLVNFLKVLRDDFLPAISDIATQMAGSGVGEQLTEFVSNISEVLQALSDTGALGLFGEVIAGVLKALNALLNIPGVTEFIGTALGIALVFGKVRAAARGLGGLLRGVGKAFEFLGKGGIGNVLKQIGTFLGRFGRLGALFNLLRTAVMGAAAVIAGVLGVSIGWALAIIAALVAAVVGVIWAFKNWDQIKEWATKLWTWIQEAVPKAVAALGQFVSAVVGFVSGLPQRIAGLASGAATALVKWIQDAIPKAGTAIGRFFGQLVGNFLRGIILLGAYTIKAGITLWKWIQEAIPKAVSAIGRWAASTGRAIADFVKNLPGRMVRAASALWKWINEAAAAAPGRLARFASRVWNWAKNFVSELPGKFVDAFQAMVGIGEDIINGLIQGVRNMGSAFWDTLTGIVGDAIDQAKGILGISSPSKVFVEIGKNIGDGFGIGVNKGFDRVSGRIGDKIQKAIDDAKKKQKAALEEYGKTLDKVSAASQAILDRALERTSVKLEEVRQELVDIAAAAKQYVLDVASSVNAVNIGEAFNLSQNDRYAGTLRQELEKQLKLTQDFSARIQQLIAQGISPEALQQVIAAGPTAGLQIANELAADQNLLDRFNRIYSQAANAATAAGEAASKDMYDGEITRLENKFAKVSREIVKIYNQAEKKINRKLKKLEQFKVKVDIDFPSVDELIAELKAARNKATNPKNSGGGLTRSTRVASATVPSTARTFAAAAATAAASTSGGSGVRGVQSYGAQVVVENAVFNNGIDITHFANDAAFRIRAARRAGVR